MRDEEMEAKIAKTAGLREDVVHACGYSSGKLKQLFEKAVQYEKWDRFSNKAFLVTLGGVAGGTVLGNISPFLFDLGMTAMLGGFLATGGLNLKRNTYDVSKEIKKTANDRLIELDQQERGHHLRP